MALSNAKGLADMSVPQYDAISTSEFENHEKVLTINQEDQDTARVKNKLNEEASPLTERSVNKPSIQISAVPNTNNLFELLIKRVETATPSEKNEVSCEEQNAVDDRYTRKGEEMESLEKLPLVNSARSAAATNPNLSSIPNGKASENQDKTTTDDNRTAGRSIFEHLRKNFRLPENDEQPTAYKLLNSSNMRTTQVNDVNKSSSTGETNLISTIPSHNTPKIDKGSDIYQTPRISGTHPVHSGNQSKPNINNDSNEPQLAAGQNFEMVSNDESVFPFTQRLKWMSHRSREGSPSLPQQQAYEQLNGSCYHSDVQRTNDMSEPVHVEVCSSHVPGFQRLFSDISSTSGSSPVTVRLQNGSLTSSLSNATSMPMQIPKNDTCLVIEPRFYCSEVNVNFNDRNQNQQRELHTKTQQRSAISKTVFQTSSGHTHGIIQSNPVDNVRILSDNTQGLVRPQSNQNPQENIPSLHPQRYQEFTNAWEQRVDGTSSIPTKHRTTGSTPFISNSSMSAFSSPSNHHQRNTRGNLVTQEARNTQQIHLAGSSFQPVRLERPRQELKFTNTHYYITNVNSNSLSCNESFPKSPDHYSTNDRVFRPVSPTWTHPLFSSSISSGLGHYDSSTKSTASDADRDEFSYACALHESANSPDIERMLGSESPIERSTMSSPPSSCESPSVTTTVVSSSTMSALRFSDSEDFRDSASFSDSSSTTVLSSSVSTATIETCVDKTESISQKAAENNSSNTNTNGEKKKRKLSLNVIHKRLEPKLPSPVRETPSSGDLYQDPSKLTREERALQRAMMRFSEMEMKEKVVPSLPKKKRATENKAVESKTIREPTSKSEKKISSSTWLLKLKLKRQKLCKKHADPTPEVKTEPTMDPIDVQNPIDENNSEDKKKTKIKRKVLNDDIEQNKKAKRKKKLMNVEKKILTKKGAKKPDVEREAEKDENFAKSTDEILKKKKKKKAKKLLLKKKLEEKRAKKREIKHAKGDHSKNLPTVPSGNQELPSTEVATIERKKSTDERHRVISKTYMLVPSYQGFKDFQPIVIESRTRNKRAIQHIEPEKETKPQLPLLVVESVNSKPVKEMVVAENEEVQKLVTDCLRVQGKWHGDELEQALKREEAELNEEVNRFRDARKLSVNRTTGETILHKAARLGYDEIVKQCILEGADPNAKDNAGWTPLHEACARGKLAVVKVLARYGADINSQSNDGIRPIHDAAEAGHVDVIRVLLSYGADPFLVTYAGHNALACAKHPIIKKYLQDYSVDIGYPVPGVPLEEERDGWEFYGSSSILDKRPERMAGILDSVPDCSETFFPEFEISDRPHLPTYNLPIIKDGVIVGRRNYLLLQELYQNGYVAKTTIQKKLKNADVLELPWSKFLNFLSENQVAVKPSFTPEGTSAVEPKAQLIPLNYTIRKLLGIRTETCRQ